MIDRENHILCVAIEKGKVHDFTLFKKSRLPLSKKIAVLVDLGYQGIQRWAANVTLPHKASKLHSLDKQQKKENRALASLRIAIEHINAKIKTFKILSQQYRNRRKRFGLRFTLICALINFDHGFVRK